MKIKIEVIPGKIGAAIHGNLAIIGNIDWRFLYRCGHFAPDHLHKQSYSRSGQKMCVLCVKQK